MKQIGVLSHRIAWQCRANISSRWFGLFLLFAILFDCSFARGPHHPKSEINRRAQQQKHINEHLAFEAKHIQEDVKAQHLPTEKKVEEMTEEERNYLYFKVHDLDGNDKLDGLEIFYSATHHSASDENHEHEHEKSGDEHKPDESSEKTNAAETQEIEKSPQSNDSEQNSNASNLKLLELDENGEIVNKNINHIIDVLDNFLSLADLNNDGYLNYAEYAAAVKLGNSIANAEQNNEL